MERARLGIGLLFFGIVIAIDGCSGGYEPEGVLAPQQQAAGPKLALSATAYDFGVVGCGLPPPPDGTITLSNTGSAPLTWSATLNSSGPFVIREPSRGTIPPGGTATLAIGVGAFGQDGLPAGATSLSLVTLATDDPDAPEVDVTVQVTRGGGAVELVPPEISFGEVPLDGVTREKPVSLRNNGNMPLTISIAQPDHERFSLTWPSSPEPIATTLEPGQSLDGLVARFTPSAAGNVSAAAAITVSSPICTPAPDALLMSGRASNSRVLVSPSQVAFGNAYCGQAAGGVHRVTIQNDSATKLTFQAAFQAGAGSLFNVTPASGEIESGAAAELQVTTKAVPTNGGTGLRADKLVVTTDAPGDEGGHYVDVSLVATGAMFFVSPTSIDFGNVNTNGNGRERTISVTDSGNLPGAALYFSLSAAAFNIIGAHQVVGSGTITVRAKPNGTGVKTANVQISTPWPLCAPLNTTTVALRCRGT